MADELKPCPFCGGDAVLRDGECGIRGMPMTWRNPQCTRCGCDLGYCHHLEAVERWNRRALSHAAGQDGEQCRAASGDYRWLEELRERMEHCVSAADEGEDYAVPREMLDAMTTLGLMEKVGRGRWAPTGAGREFAERKPTLPVEIYGKCYEVPIRVQLHIVNLEEKLRALSRGVPEGST